ncbi:YybH family protein [Mucilaginibacter jinjuensis]|uniref:DUF4440 domain-containing protein n=1 Tax=Mucilaginibacter jinjuensis TaxID=1176721 RepID=A0ABY7TB37_9SPHI|nr:DUF4440 domain-containing protein [Mucilaginibacter jinjuensis]WCT13444.1 DUF4440 domain-containing protein [Mucilaginibacter jinjuensis]
MKKLTLLFVCLGMAGALFDSCESKSVHPSDFDLAVARKEIEATNKEFANLFIKGDSVGVANLYTTDAKFMDAGAPAVVGKPAIRSIMAGFMKSGLTRVDLKTTGLFGDANLLAEEGELKLYVKEQQVADEKYIVLWKKENAKWKLFRDISNSNVSEKK